MPIKTSKKKRVISFALALMMFLALLPATALAAEPFPTTLEAPSNVVVSESTDKNYKYIYVTFNKSNKSAELSAMIDGGRATAEKYGLDRFDYFVQNPGICYNRTGNYFWFQFQGQPGQLEMEAMVNTPEGWTVLHSRRRTVY